MASVKLSFIPSESSAVVGYNLYAGVNQFVAMDKVADLGLPDAVDGKMTLVYQDAPLDRYAYGVKAYNSMGDESLMSNVVSYDPRINPPTELVAEDV